MDHYCLLGNPVEHSKSPDIHARFAELTGEKLHYGKRLVALDGFAAALQQLQQRGTRGCNVTVPFKFEAFQAAHRASERAQLAQAANTLRLDDNGIYADNTDGAGLVQDIQRNAGLSLAGLDVLLIGAGGAAAGVMGELLGAGPSRLVVTNRTPEKATALVEHHLRQPSLTAALRKAALSAQAPTGLHEAFDVVINATASSLAGAAPPVGAQVLKPGALAYDMMYGPAADSFMDWARGHGAVARDGLGMLVEQAAEAFLLWRGVRPPSAQVLAEMRVRMQGLRQGDAA